MKKKDARKTSMAGEWTTKKLGDVCLKIGSGATPRGGSDIYSKFGKTALIRSQNVYNEGFHHDGLAYLEDEQASELANVEVQPGDVLLNITGDSIARACQVDPSVLPARVNQHVAIVRPDSHKIDPKFLRYYLILPSMQSTMLSWGGSGGTRNALTKGMIESFEIYAPREVSEQRAIADILGTLDDKIELNRKMNATLEEMARVIFKSWFVDFEPVRAKMDGRWQRGQSLPGLPAHLFDLFPDKLVNSELGEIPEGWEEGKLVSISVLNPEVWTNDTRPAQLEYIDLSNTKWGRIEAVTKYSSFDAPSRAQRVLRPGDTIIGTVRPGNGSYALISDAGLTGSTGFAVLRPMSLNCKEYIYLAATCRENIEALSHLADGGAYPAVRPEVVASTPCIIPSDDVLRAFSQLTGLFLVRIAHCEQESRTLAALRDTLLPKLITGQIRVKDAEKFLKERGL